MINIQETSQITKIYLVTNCYGDPNKIYIGKTKSCRKSKHQRTYGKQITYDYIDEINSLHSRDWKPLECFWIEYFRFLGFDIQNKNKGGGGVSFQPQSFIDKMSKPISQYTLDGVFINKWDSLIQIKNTLGFNWTNISKCCRNLQKSSNNYLWKFHKSNNNIDEYIKNKFIYQYDLSGNIIKKWKSLIEITKQTGYLAGNISNNCSKTTKSSNGFIWSYEFPLDGIPQRKYKIEKEVVQYDLEGNFIKNWDGIPHITKETKYKFNNIYGCCMNSTKSAYSYIWKYKK